MRINEDFIKEKVDGDCVLVPTGEGYQRGIFTLNEDAEKIYNLLCDGKTRDGIIEILSEEYENGSGELSVSVDGYIDELKKVGILIDD